MSDMIAVVALMGVALLLLALAYSVKMRDLFRAARHKYAHDVNTVASSKAHLLELLSVPRNPALHHIAVISIDHFKHVNEGYGVEVGDALLQAVAQALTGQVAAHECVARLGGASFCLVLADQEPEALRIRLTRIRDALGQVSIETEGLQISRSVTISAVPLTTNTAPLERLLTADVGLVVARERGESRIFIAEQNTGAQSAPHRQTPTLEAMRRALLEGELLYHVQPIHQLANGAAVGVEALIRWQTKTGDVLPPEVFLDTLIDQEVSFYQEPLLDASKTLRAFEHLGDNFFCSFNVTQHFLERFAGAGHRDFDILLNCLPPERTVFELVESSVIANRADAKRAICALRAAGYRIALDDFGTGHSNLERLKDYPIDIVKLDRQFVAGLGQHSSCNAILIGLKAMSATMGFEIVAEGIETKQQCLILEKLGIEYGQGFLFGKPARPDRWAERLFSEGTLRVSE